MDRRAFDPACARHDDFGLAFRELVEPSRDARDVAIRRLRREIDEDAEVACLRGEQLVVEALKLGVLLRERRREELESLARSRLDERADEEAIDERRAVPFARE